MTDGPEPARADLAALRARQQATVAALGVRALAGLDTSALLQEAAEVVARTLDTELVKVLALQPNGATARLVAGVGWREGVVDTTTVAVGRDSQAGYALLSRAPVIVDDLASETRLDDPPLLREHGVVSGVSVILYGPGGSSYGVLGAHTTRRRRFTQDDVHVLQGIANVLSAAMQRRHVEDELRRARDEAEAFAAQLQDQAIELEQQTEEAQTLAEELEQTNAELVQATREAERARDASAFLAETSRLLAASLEYETTLRTVAAAAVPWLGDWCAVDLVRDPEAGRWPPTMERLVIVHQDPAKVARSWAIAERYPPDWGDVRGLGRVLRDGATVFIPAVPDAMLAATARDAEHLALLRSLRFSSMIVAPLVARGRTLGTLTLCHTESGRHYDEADRALAEDLAQRAGLAVDNARLYRAAQTARHEAEAANVAKSQFLAVMSHELRTPLNAIAGYAELMEMGIHGPVTDAQREALGRIDRAQHHLLGLINDVLNYTRLESGRVEYDLEPTAVADVVRDVWPMVGPLVAAKGLTLDVRLPEDAGVAAILVWADREKLAQVLLNLLSNAVKFTPADRGGVPGRVTVDLTEQATEGERRGGGAAWECVYLRVCDTGVGIPASKLDAIFEPFVQVRSELTREVGGTGLGLAISRDLARGMGGELTARSEEGKGSAFTVALRRVTSPAGEPTDRRVRAERRDGAERRVANGRDGNAEVRQTDRLDL